MLDSLSISIFEEGEKVKNGKIRVGIIGAGMIGTRHIENYKSVPEAEVVAVADLNEAAAKRASESHGIPDYTNDFRNLLKREDIDAVDVCVHNNLHAPITVEALEAGKHVYCEKSMAGSYIDAFHMMEASKKSKKKLAIQLNSLFEPETRAAKYLVDKGELGEIYHVRSTGFRRRGRPWVDGYGTPSFVQKKWSGGGSTLDMVIYHVGTLLYLLDNPEVTRVSGKTYQELPMHEGKKKQAGYDVEELSLGFVRFGKKLTMDIIESWAVNLGSMEGSAICGTLGGIRLHSFGNPENGNKMSFYPNLEDLEMTSTINLETADYRWKQLYEGSEVYESSQRHWISALQGRVKLLPTADVALSTMLICDGIYLSNKLGREVTAEEIKKYSKSTALKV